MVSHIIIMNLNSLLHIYIYIHIFVWQLNDHPKNCVLCRNLSVNIPLLIESNQVKAHNIESGLRAS